MKTLKTVTESLWDVWNDSPEGQPERGFEEDLKELHQAMGVERRRHRQLRTILFAFAAAACLAVVMTGEYLIINKRNVPVETVTLLTSRTSKGEFRLPDGSQVWLNSSSSLSYDKNNPRYVRLEGEGFFDVAKKNGEPFFVNTGSLSVKVTGTRFNVRSSNHFDREEVSLVSGRVEVSAGGNTMALSPGEKAAVSGDVLETVKADVSLDSAWIGQELVFDGVALSDILTTLEHWYNVNIRYASGVNLRSRLSFKVRKESLEETQRIITRLTNCRFKKLDDRNILITNK